MTQKAQHPHQQTNENSGDLNLRNRTIANRVPLWLGLRPRTHIEVGEGLYIDLPSSSSQGEQKRALPASKTISTSSIGSGLPLARVKVTRFAALLPRYPGGDYSLGIQSRMTQERQTGKKDLPGKRDYLFDEKVQAASPTRNASERRMNGSYQSLAWVTILPGYTFCLPWG